MITQKGKEHLAKDKQNRPIRKLAYGREFKGDTSPRTAAYTNVREDASTGSTYKLPAEVEFPNRSNIYLRILSGIVLVPLFVIAILWFKPLFYILMILVGMGMLSEWYNMTYSSIPYLLIGLIIIPIPISLLIFLSMGDTNRWLIMLYFCIIWSVDSFAMIGGKTFKGAKLAPKISLKKTWSGLVTGVLSAGLVAVLASFIPNFHIENYYFSNKIYLFIISCILALIAQSSDLFISYFKRKFNIKDSGHIIPGHGGVLDRFDSIILTAPVLFFISNIL